MQQTAAGQSPVAPPGPSHAGPQPQAGISIRAYFFPFRNHFISFVITAERGAGSHHAHFLSVQGTFPEKQGFSESIPARPELG